jgi:hypothetical protein
MMFMKDQEHESKTPAPVRKVIQSVSKTPTMEQLKSMTTDQLVKLLLSPELAKSANAPLRQQVIQILQEREGNAFVQRLIGKTVPGKSP